MAVLLSQSRDVAVLRSDHGNPVHSPPRDDQAGHDRAGLPIVGVVAAFVLRSAAGAITLVLALLFVPGMFGALLPRRWQEDVLAWLPGSLADSVAMHHLDPDNPLYADPALAAALLVAWIVALTAGTWYLLNRRDV